MDEMLKTANLAYDGSRFVTAGRRDMLLEQQQRVLNRAAQMIIETAAFSCDDADSPAAAGFIASLECILSPEEEDAYNLVADAIRKQRQRNNASV